MADCCEEVFPQQGENSSHLTILQLTSTFFVFKNFITEFTVNWYMPNVSVPISLMGCFDLPA